MTILRCFHRFFFARGHRCLRGVLLPSPARSARIVRQGEERLGTLWAPRYAAPHVLAKWTHSCLHPAWRWDSIALCPSSHAQLCCSGTCLRYSKATIIDLSCFSLSAMRAQRRLQLAAAWSNLGGTSVTHGLGVRSTPSLVLHAHRKHDAAGSLAFS